MHNVVRKTESLCPECLKKIEAFIYEKDKCMYMKKKCHEHGEFDTLVWEDSAENYLQWIEYGGTPKDKNNNKNLQEVEKGCPYDCGICTDHVKNITSAALMTTNVCDVDCPICFTKDKNEGIYMPTNQELLELAENYKKTYSSEHLIELCGGEPTIRDDLPILVEKLTGLGFEHIQLNTNGIRIANDLEYLTRLKESGVTVVYLGFDGVTDDVYLKKYNRKMLDIKLRAIENCTKVKLAVVLVPVVINGVNSESLGEIVELAKKNMPTVKAINFQPISYFGNYPLIPLNSDRITIPKVLRNLELQTKGEVKKSHFRPGGCEHALCSFTSFYMMGREGKLKALSKYDSRGINEDSAEKVIRNNKKIWTYSKIKTLAIGGMHFQDVWNIDIERIKKCRICILNTEQKIIPLCVKYVTSTKGEKLYDGIS